MNDEIREILQTLEGIASGDWIQMLPKEANKLLDYITNLQKENERLKEENKHIFANVNDDELLISNAMNYAEAQDYKSRVEKAYEELTYMSSSDYVEDYDIKQNCWIKLSNILQNGSDASVKDQK